MVALRRDDDDRYSYADVSWLLEHYHYLRDRLGPRQEQTGEKPNHRFHYEPEKMRAIRRAEIDRALTWLSQLDQAPIMADAIRAYYIDGWPIERVASESRRQRAKHDALLGLIRWQGISRTEAYERIHQGIERMVRLMNGLS